MDRWLALYQQITHQNGGDPDAGRLLLAWAPWRLGVHRIFNHLQYPWVLGYKKHPILYTNFKYLDLDVVAQQAAAK